jgi:predicted metalloprotease
LSQVFFLPWYFFSWASGELRHSGFKTQLVALSFIIIIIIIIIPVVRYYTHFPKGVLCDFASFADSGVNSFQMQTMQIESNRCRVKYLTRVTVQSEIILYYISPNNETWFCKQQKRTETAYRHIIFHKLLLQITLRDRLKNEKNTRQQTHTAGNTKLISQTRTACGQNSSLQDPYYVWSEKKKTQVAYTKRRWEKQLVNLGSSFKAGTERQKI